MKQDTSSNKYFSQLSFDSKLQKGFFHFFVSRPRAVILMIILLTGWGSYAYLTLPRESSPEVKIPVAIVSVVFPGASPNDVEELVTKKVETELSSLKGVDTIESSSSNSLSITSINFNASEDLENAIRSVRDSVDNIKSQLPDQANDPIVSEISFSDQPVLTLSLTGPYDGTTLYTYAETLQKELEKVSGVREVLLSGGDQIEFSINYIPEKITAYGISPTQANQAVSARNTSIPGGNYDGESFSYPVRSDARFFTAQALGETPILTTREGAIILLRDIATITESPIPQTTTSRFSLYGSAPENAVTLDIKKKTGGSVLDIVENAKRKAEEMTTSFGKDIKIETTVDFSEQIREDFNQLGKDFAITVLLVVGTLFLIVGLKEALIAGLAIPLVFFSTFGVMMATGTSLNFLSLFSLILSLGLLVDDAIVVVSATKQYLRSGKFTPEEAILLVLRDFKIVLLTTTLATTFAFLPLLLASGIIGEFIKSIPITVSVTLISSLIIALLINNPLAAALERVRFTKTVLWISIASLLIFSWISLAKFSGVAGYLGTSLALAGIASLLLFRFSQKGEEILASNARLLVEEKKDDSLIKERLRKSTVDHPDFFHRLIHGIVGFERIIPIYERSLQYILISQKHRIVTLVATVVLFLATLSLPILGIVKTEFFPSTDSNLLFVNVTAQSGLKLDETDAITKRIEEKLRSYPEIESFSTIVGRAGTSANSSGGASGNSSNLAGITIRLIGKEDRDIPSYDLATKLRNDLAIINEATVTVEAEQGGPPAGAAFEARISGEDLRILSATANELKDILETIPGVVGADISLKEAPAEYTFTLNPDRVALYGLDATSIGSTLRMAISGVEISTVLRDNKEYPVIARFDASSLPTLESVQNLQIINRNGSPVFLKDVATIELKPSVNSIKRADEQRVVTLAAGVEGQTNPQDVLKAFQEQLDQQEYTLPEGYTISYGGQNEENAKSVQSILQAMIIAAVLIITVLVIQFNSFRKAVLVLVTLPLALIGVFIGLAIFQIPLSFPGLIGILALFGIVVKNAIILVDKINLNLQTGIPFEESILDAGKSRIEAIVITSLCTILGILPVTLSNDTWRALGSAVIFGLVFSSFLTLFIIPTLYSVIARKEEREK